MPNLFIVADGMGGHKAGDYASRYTVETIEREIKASFEKNPSIIIQKAIRTANKEIRQRASEDPNLYGMGTTVVVATVIGRYLQVANVGDSRLYIANGQEIRQITRDHSLVEEMVRLGGIKREEARLHPDKNIITRAIGAKDDVDIDFFTVELRPSDRAGQREVLKKLLGKTGENFTLTAPFWCDYGYNIELGENFYANHNLVILDGAKVTFGDNVFIGPDCGFHTAGHPIDFERRIMKGCRR